MEEKVEGKIEVLRNKPRTGVAFSLPIIRQRGAILIGR
jgi:hypothetical protein